MKAKRKNYYAVMTDKLIVEVFTDKQEAEKLQKDYNENDIRYYEVVKGLDNISRRTGLHIRKSEIKNMAIII